MFRFQHQFLLRYLVGFPQNMIEAKSNANNIDYTNCKKIIF